MKYKRTEDRKITIGIWIGLFVGAVSGYYHGGPFGAVIGGAVGIFIGFIFDPMKPKYTILEQTKEEN